ncbi:MAG TPA: hypothetical protein VEA61_09100 [Allosphingosinicella sp.]|nr:hypothetical protein [Allosphingosinicella sp.]
MGGRPDNDRKAAKPFLIEKIQDGGVRLTLRKTRYNGQGYPIVTTTRLEPAFASAAAARAHAKENYGAQAGDFASG